MATKPVICLSNGTFRIRSWATYHMGQYLTLDKNKNVVATSRDDTSDAQLWNIYKESDGRYTIRNNVDGAILQAQRNPERRGGEAEGGTIATQWTITPRGVDGFVIGFPVGPLVIDLNAYGEIIFWEYNGLPHQRWFFESVSRPPVIVHSPAQPTAGNYRIACWAPDRPKLYFDLAPDFQLTALPFDDTDDGQTWHITPEEDGKFKIVNVGTQAVLECRLITESTPLLSKSQTSADFVTVRHADEHEVPPPQYFIGAGCGPMAWVIEPRDEAWIIASSVDVIELDLANNLILRERTGEWTQRFSLEPVAPKTPILRPIGNLVAHPALPLAPGTYGIRNRRTGSEWGVYANCPPSCAPIAVFPLRSKQPASTFHPSRKFDVQFDKNGEALISTSWGGRGTRYVKPGGAMLAPPEVGRSIVTCQIQPVKGLPGYFLVGPPPLPRGQTKAFVDPATGTQKNLRTAPLYEADENQMWEFVQLKA